MKIIIIILIVLSFPLAGLAGNELYSKTLKLPNGLLVCAVKHDQPHKSFKGKKRHIDRECCLDPDERPNPLCYYGIKYHKYLNK
jgi:hypothetical protein